MARKKLPIGIQTFAKIRGENYYFVDKTAYALKLINEGSYYFLARPRRFGKSLFLDTLAELFAGNEPLFRGLHCHDKWDWSVQYPVVRLSFGGGRLENRIELDRRIRTWLEHTYTSLDLPLTASDDIPGCFASLLAAAAKKFGQRVVVLVDEYDKPILDHIDQPEVAGTMRDGLRNLYSVIKDCDAHIKFAFLTGVSRFSKVSIFSGLNNLYDISLAADYSAICGYTEEDVDTLFGPELEGLNRQAIRDWYNGYNWLGEPVYNPFDLLLLFQQREFRSYWFETGTPTFLVDWLRQRGYFTPQLENTLADDELLSSFDVDAIEPEAMLWQTGYLTLKERLREGDFVVHRLGPPNLEVRTALNRALLGGWLNNAAIHSQIGLTMRRAFSDGNLSLIHQCLTSLFASIPHDWYRNNPITRYEGYWASVFYSHLAALGLDLVAEDVTQHGRIDLTVKLSERVVLFEFKVVESGPEGQALHQLKARAYAGKYLSSGLPIHLVGVEFSREERNVVAFEVERA